MSKQFDFTRLFIFDLANNHQGDVGHGINIIKGIADVVKKHKVRGVVKFQFRELESFIHPEYRQSKENKHIQRFLSTRIPRQGFEDMLAEIRKQGLISACTPFDEASVDEIMAMGIDIIKVASCSALDWPLLEKIAQTGKPVIVSTAGMSLSNIEKLVSFLENKNVNFAMMHCVAVYPTSFDKLRLNQIELLRERFPQISVGFSTHEEPDNYTAVMIALAKGAMLFERHVGLPTAKYKLNAYSSTPQQIDKWITAYEHAVQSCGGENRSPGLPEEIESLRSLSRGVFAKKELKKNQKIKRSDVFFAMPLLDEQLTSGDWHEWLVADKKYKANEKISNSLSNLAVPSSQLVYQLLLHVKGMLNNARIFIGADSAVEISHHFGLERFREFGCVIVNCINRAYAKKLVILLPRQKHPYHYHKIKEETFQLLYGDMEVEIEGVKTKMDLGDTVLVKPGQWHKFHTLDGAIFEEVSTTHLNDDSFYEDERIAMLPRDKRKTYVPNWEKNIKENAAK
ncbi:MAG: N-acetylneuraminate synthase family protein [bacterium]|nr:N-acetylneuraminate synthase family protein [bacterium]